MFNKVILVGNLTRDIELRYINTGSALGRTGIAVNRKYTVNGEKKEEVCFIDITFWFEILLIVVLSITTTILLIVILTISTILLVRTILV